MRSKNEDGFFENEAGCGSCGLGGCGLRLWILIGFALALIWIVAL